MTIRGEREGTRSKLDRFLAQHSPRCFLYVNKIRTSETLYSLIKGEREKKPRGRQDPPRHVFYIYTFSKREDREQSTGRSRSHVVRASARHPVTFCPAAEEQPGSPIRLNAQCLVPDGNPSTPRSPRSTPFFSKQEQPKGRTGGFRRHAIPTKGQQDIPSWNAPYTSTPCRLRRSSISPRSSFHARDSYGS